MQPCVHELHPVLGLGSGGRLLKHLQTPFLLYWINFSPRATATMARWPQAGTPQRRTSAKPGRLALSGAVPQQTRHGHSAVQSWEV